LPAGDGVEVGHLAETVHQQHRHNGVVIAVRASLQHPLECRGVHVEGAGLDIDEHRFAAA